MTPWFRLLFVFSSFGPLYFLLVAGLIAHEKTDNKIPPVGGQYLFYAALLCCALSFVAFFIIVKSFKTSSFSFFKFNKAQPLDENVLSYMLSYLPPLMIDDLSSIKKVIPAIVFYVIIITILLRIDSLYVNPYFLIFGYRIYRVELPSGQEVVMVTKEKGLSTGELLRFYEVAPGKLFFAERGS